MDFWEPVTSRLRQVLDALTGLSPDQKIVLWIQSIVGCLTIVWIIFQFAWLRRLNEARLERYLEDRIATERDDLAQERQRTLWELERFVQSRGMRYAVLLTWANIRLAVSFVLRMLSLGTSRGLASHTQLLAQVGMLHRARSIHTDLPHDSIKRMKLYEGALANKCIEAQNALLAAGRIAAIEGRPSIAASSFRKARNLKDDPDARLMIGQQLASFSDFDGAIGEFRAGSRTLPYRRSHLLPLNFIAESPRLLRPRIHSAVLVTSWDSRRPSKRLRVIILDWRRPTRPSATYLRPGREIDELLRVAMRRR